MDKESSVLSTKTRIHLPKSEFALPKKKKPGKPGEGGYPIPDRSHARSALGFVSRFGTSAEKAKVRAKVHSEYPTMGKKAESEIEMDKIAAALALGTALAEQDLLGLRKEAMDTAARLMLMSGLQPVQPDDGFDDKDIQELSKIGELLGVKVAATPEEGKIKGHLHGGYSLPSALTMAGNSAIGGLPGLISSAPALQARGLLGRLRKGGHALTDQEKALIKKHPELAREAEGGEDKTYPISRLMTHWFPPVVSGGALGAEVGHLTGGGPLAEVLGGIAGGAGGAALWHATRGEHAKNLENETKTSSLDQAIESQKTAALVDSLTDIDLEEIVKVAQDPHMVSLLTGGGLGALLGGAAGHFGTEDKEKRTRNALLGALLGGALGTGAGELYYKGGLEPGMKSRVVEDFPRGMSRATSEVLPEVGHGSMTGPEAEQRIKEILSKEMTHFPTGQAAMGGALGGLGGAAAGYAGTSDEKKKVRNALKGLLLGGAGGAALGGVGGHLALNPSPGDIGASVKISNLDQAIESQKTDMLSTLNTLMGMEKVSLDIPGIGNVDVDAKIKSLKQLIQANPEAAGAIAGGVGGAGVGALTAGKGHRGKGALVGGLLGGGLGAAGGYGARELMKAQQAAQIAESGRSAAELGGKATSEAARAGGEAQLADLRRELEEAQLSQIAAPPPRPFQEAMQGADASDRAREAMERMRAMNEAANMPSSPPNTGSTYTGFPGLQL